MSNQDCKFDSVAAQAVTVVASSQMKCVTPAFGSVGSKPISSSSTSYGSATGSLSFLVNAGT